MDRVTPRLDLDALERMEKAATPGPWEDQYSDVPGTLRDVARGFTGSMVCAIAPRQQVRTHAPGGLFPSADGQLIAELRNAAPALLARARLAERMAEALTAMCGVTEHTYFSPTPEGHIAGESIRRVRDRSAAVLREWDALEKGDET